MIKFDPPHLDAKPEMVVISDQEVPWNTIDNPKCVNYSYFSTLSWYPHQKKLSGPLLHWEVVLIKGEPCNQVKRALTTMQCDGWKDCWDSSEKRWYCCQMIIVSRSLKFMQIHLESQELPIFVEGNAMDSCCWLLDSSSLMISPLIFHSWWTILYIQLILGDCKHSLLPHFTSLCKDVQDIYWGCRPGRECGSLLSCVCDPWKYWNSLGQGRLRAFYYLPLPQFFHPL